MDPEKLAKVLAMAESDHHGEAQSALRAARIMLARAGLTFRDLAVMIRPSVLASAAHRHQQPFHPPATQTESLMRQVRELQSQLDEQRDEMDVLRSEAESWRKLARQGETRPAVIANEVADTLPRQMRKLQSMVDKQREDLARQRLETDRWRQLARETAEQMWDLGKALERRIPQPDATDRRQELVMALRDPATAALSNHELARRIGVSVHTVSYWRRRVAVDDCRSQRRSHSSRLVHSRRRSFPGLP
ncbi:Helix-turn-helix domain-containing protein [uncultured Gammaproteobacteria bacterium]